jgi:hypothetical protein
LCSFLNLNVSVVFVGQNTTIGSSHKFEVRPTKTKQIHYFSKNPRFSCLLLFIEIQFDKIWSSQDLPWYSSLDLQFREIAVDSSHPDRLYAIVFVLCYLPLASNSCRFLRIFDASPYKTGASILLVQIAKILIGRIIRFKSRLSSLKNHL